MNTKNSFRPDGGFKQSCLFVPFKKLDLAVSGEVSTVQFDTIVHSASGSPLESTATAVNPI